MRTTLTDATGSTQTTAITTRLRDPQPRRDMQKQNAEISRRRQDVNIQRNAAT